MLCRWSSFTIKLDDKDPCFNSSLWHITKGVNRFLSTCVSMKARRKGKYMQQYKKDGEGSFFTQSTRYSKTEERLREKNQHSGSS